MLPDSSSSSSSPSSSTSGEKQDVDANTSSLPSDEHTTKENNEDSSSTSLTPVEKTSNNDTASLQEEVAESSSSSAKSIPRNKELESSSIGGSIHTEDKEEIDKSEESVKNVDDSNTEKSPVTLPVKEEEEVKQNTEEPSNTQLDTVTEKDKEESTTKNGLLEEKLDSSDNQSSSSFSSSSSSSESTQSTEEEDDDDVSNVQSLKQNVLPSTNIGSMFSTNNNTSSLFDVIRRTSMLKSKAATLSRRASINIAKQKLDVSQTVNHRLERVEGSQKELELALEEARKLITSLQNEHNLTDRLSAIEQFLVGFGVMRSDDDEEERHEEFKDDDDDEKEDSTIASDHERVDSFIYNNNDAIEQKMDTSDSILKDDNNNMGREKVPSQNPMIDTKNISSSGASTVIESKDLIVEKASSPVELISKDIASSMNSSSNKDINHVNGSDLLQSKNPSTSDVRNNSEDSSSKKKSPLEKEVISANEKSSANIVEKTDSSTLSDRVNGDDVDKRNNNKIMDSHQVSKTDDAQTTQKNEVLGGHTEAAPNKAISKAFGNFRKSLSRPNTAQKQEAVPIPSAPHKPQVSNTKKDDNDDDNDNVVVRSSSREDKEIAYARKSIINPLRKKSSSLILHMKDQEDRVTKRTDELAEQVKILSDKLNERVSRKSLQTLLLNSNNSSGDTDGVSSSWLNEIESIHNELHEFGQKITGMLTMSQLDSIVSTGLGDKNDVEEEEGGGVEKETSTNDSASTSVGVSIKELKAFKTQIENKLEILFATKLDKEENKLMSKTLDEKLHAHETAIENLHGDVSTCKAFIDVLEAKIQQLNGENNTHDSSTTGLLDLDERINRATEDIRKSLQESLSKKLDDVRIIEAELERLTSQMADRPDQSQVIQMLQSLEEALVEQLGDGKTFQMLIDNMKIELNEKTDKGDVLSLVRQLLGDARQGIQNTQNSLMVGHTRAAYRCLGCNRVFPGGVNGRRAAPINHKALPAYGLLSSKPSSTTHNNTASTTTSVKTTIERPGALRPLHLKKVYSHSRSSRSSSNKTNNNRSPKMSNPKKSSSSSSSSSASQHNTKSISSSRHSPSKRRQRSTVSSGWSFRSRKMY